MYYVVRVVPRRGASRRALGRTLMIIMVVITVITRGGNLSNRLVYQPIAVFRQDVFVRILDTTCQVVGHDSVQALVIARDQVVGPVDYQGSLEEVLLHGQSFVLVLVQHQQVVFETFLFLISGCSLVAQSDILQLKQERKHLFKADAVVRVDVGAVLVDKVVVQVRWCLVVLQFQVEFAGHHAGSHCLRAALAKPSLCDVPVRCVG